MRSVLIPRATRTPSNVSAIEVRVSNIASKGNHWRLHKTNPLKSDELLVSSAISRWLVPNHPRSNHPSGRCRFEIAATSNERHVARFLQKHEPTPHRRTRTSTHQRTRNSAHQRTHASATQRPRHAKATDLFYRTNPRVVDLTASKGALPIYQKRSPAITFGLWTYVLDQTRALNKSWRQPRRSRKANSFVGGHNIEPAHRSRNAVFALRLD